MSLRWLLLAVLSLFVTLGCHRTASNLPDYGPIPAFALTDQSGRPVSNASLKNKVWAAAFVFTRCPTACPRVTRAMRAVQLAAAEKKVPLLLVSFSIDPDNDTPDVLRKYATEYGADLSTWSFVTGDAGKIRDTAEKGFKIAVEGTADPSRSDFGITHGTQLVLIDAKGHIRGYYATNDEQALRDLVVDAGKVAGG